MRQSLHLEHDSVQILQNIRDEIKFYPDMGKYDIKIFIPFTNIRISNWYNFESSFKFDIVFECTFCLYLQIIITFCLIKHDIYDRNITLDLRTFSVYEYGAWTLIQMHLI